MAEKKFLDKLQRLEEIGKLLENGECSLEDAMKLYEEGKTLAEECTKALEEAKQKIEVEK
ncbi:MAG: exodeoxyribonuclease VII small subunit [Clostridia bacterium]|nr:exodeoxyribonuclease VII small subunit [Clostridia bacterium]